MDFVSMSEDDADYAIKIMNQIKLYGKSIRATSDKKIWTLDPGVGEKMLYDTFSTFGVLVQTPKNVLLSMGDHLFYWHTLERLLATQAKKISVFVCRCSSTYCSTSNDRSSPASSQQINTGMPSGGYHAPGTNTQTATQSSSRLSMMNGASGVFLFDMLFIEKTGSSPLQDCREPRRAVECDLSIGKNRGPEPEPKQTIALRNEAGYQWNHRKARIEEFHYRL
ncbi:hypothetical protein C1646_752415 [Rhizophagus diaphanus]|nr:hypothetical protein C1646_752415 [Rhizophagus diaphanus] [Rhizophagus sp. MUCL 43196]